MKYFKLISLFLLSVLISSSCGEYSTKGVKAKGNYVIPTLIYYTDYRNKIVQAPQSIQNDVIKSLNDRKLKAFIYPFNSYRKTFEGDLTPRQRLNHIIPKLKGSSQYICLVEIYVEKVADKNDVYTGGVTAIVYFYNVKDNLFYDSKKISKTIYESREKDVLNRVFIVIKDSIIEEISKYVDKEFADK